MEHLDAIIIGFGKGGKLLAADLANRGQQVAIIERSAAMYGGSCINIACIPTNALIHQAQMIKELNLASFEEKAAAYRKAIIKKNEITTALRKLNFDRLNDHPNITVYTGVASFRSSRKIEETDLYRYRSSSGDPADIRYPGKPTGIYQYLTPGTGPATGNPGHHRRRIHRVGIRFYVCGFRK